MVVSSTPLGTSTQLKQNPENDLSTTLLAQQLPPLPKFGGGDSPDECFQDWISQFELVAEVCKWGKQAKLINLTCHVIFRPPKYLDRPVQLLLKYEDRF